MSSPDALQRYRRVGQQDQKEGGLLEADSHGIEEDGDGSSLIDTSRHSRHSQHDPQDHFGQGSLHENDESNHLAHSFSFEFDDEDEEDLQRYHVEAERLRTESSSFQAQPTPLSPSHALPWLPYLWKIYCETRQERRQQRTQQLLNLHTKRQRYGLWISSWCDLYDRGWSIWLGVVIIWVLLCRFYRGHRFFLIGVGLPFLLLRFCWQPLMLYFRQTRRRRPSTWEPVEQPGQPGVVEEWERPTSTYRDHDVDDGDASPIERQTEMRTQDAVGIQIV